MHEPWKRCLAQAYQEDCARNKYLKAGGQTFERQKVHELQTLTCMNLGTLETAEPRVYPRNQLTHYSTVIAKHVKLWNSDLVRICYLYCRHQIIWGTQKLVKLQNLRHLLNWGTQALSYGGTQTLATLRNPDPHYVAEPKHSLKVWNSGSNYTG
jgi:hypothetical protein